MRKTKIIATYGPATASPSKIEQLIRAGVNLFRINCSHGSGNDFSKAVSIIRAGCVKSPFPVGILFDISGPKLRLKGFEGEFHIKSADTLTLTTDETDLNLNKIGVNHPAIISSVKKGERVFIDDGNIIFDVIRAGRKELVVKAKNSGTILPGKGINLPDSDIKIPTIGEKDKKDIETAIKLKADFIALSFVRSCDDIKNAKKIIKKLKGDQAVIAKLEKKEAIESLDDIVSLADGVMVARGDLGVELPFEQLPQLQKKIIRIANNLHKPVIIATQMLESMRFAPRATRAEINDVASAVFDFVDAVMLSAETATGKYPIETVKAMGRIINETEKVSSKPEVVIDEHLIESKITNAIAKAVSNSRDDCITRVIFAFTTTGYTAALISNLFPPQPVVALTHDKRVMNKLSLLRSVYPVFSNQPKSIENMLKMITAACRKYKLATKKDKVIITGGAPFGSMQITNFMMIHEM